MFTKRKYDAIIFATSNVNCSKAYVSIILIIFGHVKSVYEVVDFSNIQKAVHVSKLGFEFASKYNSVYKDVQYLKNENK